MRGYPRGISLIDWRLAFEYWGKGYASAAARGALKVGVAGARYEFIYFHTIFVAIESCDRFLTAGM